MQKESIFYNNKFLVYGFGKSGYASYKFLIKNNSCKIIDDNNNSGKSSGKFSGKSHATLSHKNMKFKIHPQAESGSIVTMDNIHKHNNSISNNGNDRMNSISYSKSYAQVALPPSQKQTGSSSSLNFDDGNTMNSTKDLLKEYKMIIKWREKQQIALQQQSETQQKDTEKKDDKKKQGLFGR